MFDGCVDLTHLDISNFDMSNVRNTENMFQYCDNLKPIMVTNCNDKTINMLKQAIREANLDHPVNLIY